MTTASQDHYRPRDAGASHLLVLGATGSHLLVLGATGYVGGRLVPELLRHGHQVRCLVRSSLHGIEWGDHVELAVGDVLQPDTLDAAFDGIDTVVYLIHSLAEDDFENTEFDSARNVRIAADRAGVRHIVYLSGLGEDTDDLSPHLRSRHAVGRELAAGRAAVTELRAAVILGAGSASFEMLRSLTEVLPVMVAPRWVTTTKVQPIAIGDALHYLRAAVDVPADGQCRDQHRIVEIGGPEQLTYRDLIDLYSEVAGLPRRRILPVPLVQPSLSTHWVNLVSLFDKIIGGVGLRRGRRHPDDITVGEALDFWRVDAIEPDLFRLRAEMLLPGEAWLEWRTTRDADDRSTHVVQKARYVPRGLAGRLYWWPLLPFHAVIFPTMLRRIARDAERRVADAASGVGRAA